MSILTYTDGGGFTFASVGNLRPGPGAPLLDFNFATGVYVGGSVGSLATSNSGGVAKTNTNTMVSFGTNTPRITNLGLLVEPAATNLVFPTSMATWSVTNATLASGTTDLLGGTGAVQVTDNSTNGQHQLFAPNNVSSTLNSGSAYTMSAFGRAGTLGFAGLSLPFALNNNKPGVTVNLNTGATQAFGSPTTSGSETWVDGSSNTWYRFYFTTTLAANGTPAPAINMNSNINAGWGQTYVGSSQTDFHWAYQLELAQASNLPSSLVVTSSGGVTRSADQVTIVLPANAGTILWTFSDGSTQVQAASPGSFTIPTNLNRPYIARMQVF